MVDFNTGDEPGTETQAAEPMAGEYAQSSNGHSDRYNRHSHHEPFNTSSKEDG